MSKRSRKQADSPNKSQENCNFCGKNASKDAIECDRCGCWEYKDCAHVSDAIYSMMDKVPNNVMFFCTKCVAIIPSVLKLHMTMESSMESVEGKLKTLECKFSNALQEVNQSLSTKLSEIEARLKVPVIDETLKSLRMLISKLLVPMIAWLFSCLKLKRG